MASLVVYFSINTFIGYQLNQIRLEEESQINNLNISNIIGDTHDKGMILNAFFIPENSGSTQLDKYIISVGDDSNKLFVHTYDGNSNTFEYYQDIYIDLNDPEAICVVAEFGSNDTATVAVYASDSIIELTLDRSLNIINTQYIRVQIDKKIESLVYIPEYDTYVLADRRSKNNTEYGDGTVYYVGSHNGINRVGFVSDDTKPTDMDYHDGILYILHEDHIERYRFINPLMEVEALEVLTFEKIKDLESMFVTDEHIFIFTDSK